MFSASRIVAIDDERAQLDKLCRALHGMGIPCIPIEYPQDVPAEGTAWFGAVRVAFCDLHLLKGATKSEQHFSAVGALLDRMSTPRSGPLLLVLWTNSPEDAGELTAYLADRHPKATPVAVVPLAKSEFDEDGKAATLPQAIRDRLNHIPQLRALLDWEDEVGAASSACVGGLLKLALQQQGDMKESLDVLLSSLAQAATGKALASEDPGAALVEVLMPMVADQLAHLPDDAARVERWREALSNAASQSTCKTTPERAAAVNTAISIVHGGRAHDRGAVVALRGETVLKLRFGLNAAQTLQRFALKGTPVHRWVAIEVEAVCDYAQQKSVCLPYVLAVEIPAEAELLDKEHRPASLWESPPFFSESGARVRLVANVKFVSTLSPTRVKRIPALYRLREPWVNDLAFARTRHESRPGIVALYN